MPYTVFVPAQFQEIFDDKLVSVPTGKTRKNFLGFEISEKEKKVERVSKGYSDCWIDGEQLAEDINEATSQAAKDGLCVQSIVPVTSGSWSYATGTISGGGSGIGRSIKNIKGDMGHSYGYSFTSGVLITFVEQIEEKESH